MTSIEQTPTRRQVITGALTGIAVSTIIGIGIAFILINWITGCGERFYRMDGSYTQGECVTPLSIWNDHRETQSTGENN